VIALRDKGQIEEAKRVGSDNTAFLKGYADKFDSDELRDEYKQQMWFNENLEKQEDYRLSRKATREGQYRSRTQQQE